MKRILYLSGLYVGVNVMNLLHYAHLFTEHPPKTPVESTLRWLGVGCALIGLISGVDLSVWSLTYEANNSPEQTPPEA